MFLDKNNTEIKLGSKITNGDDGGTYIVIKYKDELYADNGGNMFPLNSPNWNLKKFKTIS